MLANEYTEARIDLAAVLRWSARLGYQTGTCNHFSFMVPAGTISSWSIRRAISGRR
jgi:hypothetical protein